MTTIEDIERIARLRDELATHGVEALAAAHGCQAVVLRGPASGGRRDIAVPADGRPVPAPSPRRAAGV